MNELPKDKVFKIATRISGLPVSKIRYSVCTLVTKPQEYAEMIGSFVNAGFDPSFCEFLYLDNQKGNQWDGYTGGNLFLQAAQGHYIILCHQDILLNHDRLEDLERCIRELDEIDPTWAILSNAGGVTLGYLAMRITDADGDHNTNHFPVKVFSVDENFILVKRDANLCFSYDLNGFHFYGTDLCRIARVLGRTAWVVNFNLYHKSPGNCDDGFYEAKNRLIKKYRAALRGSIIQTPCTAVYLSSSVFESSVLITPERWTLFYRIYQLRKNLRRKADSRVALDEKRLMSSLGVRWYAACWVVYKLFRPFQNLKMALVKRDLKK